MLSSACLLAALLCAASGTGTIAKQSEDDSALRMLVMRYYEAVGSRDLETAKACWSGQSPLRLQKFQELTQRFAQADGATVAILGVRRVRTEGDRGFLRVEIETGRAAPGRNGGPSRIIFDVECVREEGRWTIWREEAAQVDLAARLAALGTGEERAALLAAEHELKSQLFCQALIRRGNQLRMGGEYPKAQEIYDLAAAVAREIGDPGSEADALHLLGRLHLDRDEYQEALEYYQRGLALREQLNDRAKVAHSLSGLAGLYIQLGKLDQALEFEQKSMKLREAVGDRAAIAEGWARLGYAYRNRNEIDNALDCYRRSLAQSSDAGDKASAAWMLREIGLVQYLQRDYPEALNYYVQSLKLYEELQVKIEIAQTLYNTGIVHRALGDFDRALDCYERSLRIRQEIGDRSGVAACYYSMANVHRARGSYARALEYYQKQKELSEALGNTLNVAGSLSAMATVYNDQGSPERALALQQQSLAIYRAMGQKRLIASELNNIAGSRISLGDYAGGLENFEQALALYEELKDRNGIALALLNIGSLHQWRNEPAKALEPLTGSLALAEEVGDKQLTSEALHSLASSRCALGNCGESVTLATRSAGIARAIGARTTLWMSCTALGQAYSALRQPEKARAAFDEAIRVIEELRHEVAGNVSERAGFLTNRILPYHGIVELEAGQSRVAEALFYAERAKGRALLDVLVSGREDIDAALSVHEREEAQKQTAAVVSLNDRISRELRRSKPDLNRIAVLRTGLEKARLERDTFETNVYAAHPELRVNRGELSIVSAEEALRYLPAAGAFLEFVVEETRTWLFVVTRSTTAGSPSIRAYPIALGRQDLQQRVERFRKQIAGRDLEFRAAAAELFRLLLGPAGEQLRTHTALVIIPDGPLWELPFQVLVADGKYLWEKCEVSYAPSLTVLREMAGLDDRRGAKRTGLPNLLAMGNPLPGGTPGAATLAGEGLAPLPGAEDQVKRIGSMYGNRAKVYVGAAAAEERFKREAGSYRIIHLATHGILVDSNPMYSHLIMARGGSEDGRLEAREIARLGLNADLVVLSACETARGRVGAGEGMIGLAWSFFVVGCPATIVSQWKVDDAATTGLMVEFHRVLQGSTRGPRASKAGALRQAALKIMRDPRYRHPFYWAGFILVGDGF